MTTPTGRANASQRTHQRDHHRSFQRAHQRDHHRSFLVLLVSGPLPFDVTGKTVRPPPAGTNSASAGPVAGPPITDGSRPSALGKHAVAISGSARTQGTGR